MRTPEQDFYTWMEKEGIDVHSSKNYSTQCKMQLAFLAGTTVRYRRDNCKYMYIPCLSFLMRSVGATNESLGIAAGVDRYTVNRARNFKRVRKDLGLAMLQAVKTRKFQRAKQGAK